jgi:uncharacterized protein YggU (UPF0235/DUF167 family)
VNILARPGHVRSGILRCDPRGVVVGLNAAPEQGRANRELIDLMARLLGQPRASIGIVRGEQTRFKTLRITTQDPQALKERLKDLTPKRAN